MSESDELRAEINKAIDLEEDVMALARAIDNKLQLLTGQLMLAAMGSRHPRAATAIRMTEEAKIATTQLEFDILEIRSALSDWLEAT